MLKAFKGVVTNKNVIDEAIQKKLLSMDVKLPLPFGNLDMTFCGNANKVKKRITAVADKLTYLLKQNSDTMTVNITEDIVGPKKTIEQGFIDINGGIGSAVGNLLVFDLDTKTLKFNIYNETLRENAASLLCELKNHRHQAITQNLSSYRINVNVSSFPRDSFFGDEYNKEQARDFLSKLWICADQAKHEEVENILKCDITKFYNNEKGARHIKFQINPHDIFFEVHSKIQEWWKKRDEVSYLDQNSDYFECAK